MLAFVSSEPAQDYDRTRQSLTALSRQLELAHQASLRFRTNLANRNEALTELSRVIHEQEPVSTPYVGIFVADALSCLRLRHGNETSEYLLDEISRERILPLISGGKLFRWSGQSILAVWYSRKDFGEMNETITSAFLMPVDCQVFVGMRTATFRISVRTAVLTASGSLAELVHTLDSLAKETNLG